MENSIYTTLMDLATRQAINSAVKVIIENKLFPKVSALFKQHKLNKELTHGIVTEKFEAYLSNKFAQISVMQTLVFKNQQLLIKDIYQPLTLVSSKDRKEYRVEDYDSEFIEKYKRLLIVDTAGMGKTTIMKWLFLQSIKQSAGIPLFIELRKLSSANNLINEIFTQIAGLEDNFDKKYVIELFKKGEFIFFLDGYDEIQHSEREYVSAEIQNLEADAPNNIFFLTSREEKTLTSFAGFQRFDIKEMRKTESYELLKKLDSFSELNLYEQLVVQLDSSVILETDNFLANPLSVSLIYATFRSKNNIPETKDQLYQTIFDALYEDHDLTKGYYKRNKFCDLPKSQFLKVVRKLGFLCLKENELAYKKINIEQLIDRSKDNSDHNFETSDFLNDLLTNIPLLIQEGLDYKWIHKSFIEYFAANFILIDSGNIREEILKRIWESENVLRYENLIDMYYFIDRRTFQKIFLKGLLENFLNYMNALSHDILISKSHKLLGQLLYNRSFILKRASAEDDYLLTANDFLHHYDSILKKSNFGNESITWFSRIPLQSKTYIFIMLDKPRIDRSLMMAKIMMNKMKVNLDISNGFNFINDPHKLYYLNSQNLDKLKTYQAEEILNTLIAVLRETKNLHYFDYEATNEKLHEFTDISLTDNNDLLDDL